MPTVYQSSHTGSEIDNAITKALGCQGLPAVTSSDNGKMLQVSAGLWSAVTPESNLTMSAVLDAVYPVGAIYLSVTSTSPATLFGGTWTQLKDRFLLGVGDTYTTVEDTGGAASVSYKPAGTNSGGSVSAHTLTVDQIPSHNHGWTGSSATTSDNNRGHTHTYADYYANTTAGNCALSVAQLASHNHGTQGWYSVNNGTGAVKNCVSHARITTDPANSGTDSPITNTGSGSNHNHSVSNTSSTRTSNGINQNHTHTVTAAGSIGNKGGSGSHSHGFTNPTFTGTTATIATMPPYLTVYMWKRTA